MYISLLRICHTAVAATRQPHGILSLAEMSGCFPFFSLSVLEGLQPGHQSHPCHSLRELLAFTPDLFRPVSSAGAAFLPPDLSLPGSGRLCPFLPEPGAARASISLPYRGYYPPVFHTSCFLQVLELSIAPLRGNFRKSPLVKRVSGIWLLAGSPPAGS